MSTNFQPKPEDFEDVSAHIDRPGLGDIVIDNSNDLDVQGHQLADDPADDDTADDTEAHHVYQLHDDDADVDGNDL